MAEAPKEFFVVSGARYALEEVLEKVNKTKWIPEKWKLLMGMYGMHLAFEQAHAKALAHMETVEGAGLPPSESSMGLNNALADYKKKIPEVKEIYIKEQIKYHLRGIEYMMPREKELQLEDDFEERKKVFEGDWGAIKYIEKQIERTEQQISQIQQSTRMNPIEKQVEREIQDVYLRELKVARVEILRLYDIYVRNFRVYKIL